MSVTRAGYLARLCSGKETRRRAKSQRKPRKTIESSKLVPVLLGCHGILSGSIEATHVSRSKRYKNFPSAKGPVSFGKRSLLESSRSSFMSTSALYLDKDFCSLGGAGLKPKSASLFVGVTDDPVATSRAAFMAFTTPSS
ncbi:hypothetical protein GGX14DRAFT_390662 [Mycena pura]|uniref:Uncharacterized protein n=1 Tax=Mycena pura TaxID=153505 RepID=A0AAD6VP29_9AGAR|nr:hypothetical protein GGX14DRAFT_390662 [Mycena pura]